MLIGLDATYSLGRELSGVGVYCRELLYGLAAAHSEQPYRWHYRPHRLGGSFRENLPVNCSRGLVTDSGAWPKPQLFHGLNQRLPRKKSQFMVCTFHDLFVLTGDYSTPKFRKRFAEQARQAADRADLIVAVSQFTAGQVSGLLGVPESRLRVVHHGVRPVPESSIAREEIILNVGAIQHRKNILRLVEAFERVSGDWSLVLAGSLGFGAQAILERIRVSPKSRRIHVKGYVSQTELDALYDRAGIFVFPSLDEGFGMPALEAMARRVPVLASNRSALPEVCGSAAMFVEPCEVDSIALGLQQLIDGPQVRENLVQLGLAHIQGKTWDAAVARTLAVYGELFG